MRTLPRLLIAFVLAPTLTSMASNAWAYRAREPRFCDPELGDAVRTDAKALNRLKNRSTAPIPSEIDRSVSLSAILAAGDDRYRWRPDQGATITGYVARVQMGGVESVNCHARSAQGRDTHIDLVVSPHDAADETRHVIVEITPRWRAAMAAKGLDWSTDELRQDILGRCVRVAGWMLFDAEHARESANTASPGREVWRATAWEVHPVTNLTVLAKCP